MTSDIEFLLVEHVPSYINRLHSTPSFYNHLIMIKYDYCLGEQHGMECQCSLYVGGTFSNLFLKDGPHQEFADRWVKRG